MLILKGMKLLMSGEKGGNSKAKEKSIKTRSTEADVIQFSGCRDSQTSADAHINGEATGCLDCIFNSEQTSGLHTSAPINEENSRGKVHANTDDVCRKEARDGPSVYHLRLLRNCVCIVENL